MTAPATITQQQLRQDPNAIWNQFVNLLATANYYELTEIQRSAYLVFWYEHEVQNGGHLQFFENQKAEHARETIQALEKLTAYCQSEVLAHAFAVYEARRRPRIKTPDQYVRTAIEGEFDHFDRQFHDCEPALTTALERFLERNQSDFVITEA